MDYIVDKIVKDNYEMPYVKFGNGEKAMVVIPGMSFRPISYNPDAFVEQFSRFNNEYTVYLFDRKSYMNDGYSVIDMANDTLDAIKTLNLKNINLYGASQGGIIAQLIAIKYPKLVKNLLVASTSYYNNPISDDVFNEMIRLCKEKNIRSLISYCIRKMYSKEFLDKYKDAIIKMYSDLSDDELYQYQLQCEAYKNVYTLNDLDKISAKAMIVVSQKDNIFGYESSLQMTAKLNCDCILYDEYSHCVYDEAPDFLDRLEKFFK